MLLALHGFVVEAEAAHELGAANLKPYEVVGVVDDAHLVGFGVANPYSCFSGHGLSLAFGGADHVDEGGAGLLGSGDLGGEVDARALHAVGGF